ncbi:MAG: alkaline phosphatase family protein [Myxococcales bacterium]|nr:phosphoesterase [Myxococcota bacterium]MDW8281763.1 alkaline phosphatase family protein [Myxococcales bacterium]
MAHSSLPPRPPAVPAGGITRRTALQQMSLGLGALALGCGLPPSASDAPGPGGPEPSGPEPRDEPEPTLSPRELLASIDTLVVVMMENRSFDHYLGMLRHDRAYPAAARVDGLRGDETNPDPSGQPVRIFRLDTFRAKDPPHGWDACHAQWNEGRNDGFVRAHAGPHQAEVMGYYERSQIPLYYALCDRYTVCDRWFCSVLGPTWPNRFYLHATTAEGKKNNSPFWVGGPPTVWERLRERGLRGKNYAASVAFYLGGFVGKTLAGNSPVAPLEEFFRDARQGTLPPLAMIDPDYTSNDDHPDHDIRLGQAFVATIVQALAHSPQWSRSLLVIIYDEHGGFYDHVPPPRTVDPRPEFQQLGFRVPALVVGPTVRSGFVNSTQLEHCSVAATLRTRFDIRSLGPRMDATADLSSCIDPRRVGRPAPPPTDLPRPEVDTRLLAEPGQGRSSQPELQQMLREGLIPPHLVDGRPTRERTLAWLQMGERLGAVRLR